MVLITWSSSFYGISISLRYSERPLLLISPEACINFLSIRHLFTLFSLTGMQWKAAVVLRELNSWIAKDELIDKYRLLEYYLCSESTLQNLSKTFQYPLHEDILPYFLSLLWNSRVAAFIGVVESSFVCVFRRLAYGFAVITIEHNIFVIINSFILIRYRSNNLYVSSLYVERVRLGFDLFLTRDHWLGSFRRLVRVDSSDCVPTIHELFM